MDYPENPGNGVYEFPDTCDVNSKNESVNCISEFKTVCNADEDFDVNACTFDVGETGALLGAPDDLRWGAGKAQ